MEFKHPKYYAALRRKARLQAQAKDHAGDKHNPQANQEPAVQGSNPVQPVPGSENPGKDSN